MRRRASLGGLGICFAALLALTTISCGVGGDDAPFIAYIAGFISVENPGDWANVKIGAFYASDQVADVSSDLNTEYYAGTYLYRLTYDRNNDSSMVEFTPESMSVDVTSGTPGTYSIDLPDSPPTVGNYYVVAWLDSDGDDKIDLIDATSNDTQLASSELSRCPVHTNASSDVYPVHTFSSEDGVGYKFNGYDGTTNFVDELSATNADSFDFDLTPDASTGW